MEYDLTQLDRASAYRVLASTVVPRPIAWVTTLDTRGRINAAPFSFFNLVGMAPPMLTIGFGERPGGGPKHTAQNIRDTGRFVVNLVTESLAEQMNRCAVDFEAGVDELAQAGLTTAPGVSGDVPRIAQSPVHMECVEAATIQRGRNRILLGEVVHAAVDDAFVTDPDKPYIDTNALHMIGRMASPASYTKTHEVFEMERLTPEQARGEGA